MSDDMTNKPTVMAAMMRERERHASEALSNFFAAAQSVVDWAERELKWQPIETAPWREDFDGEYDYRFPDSGQGVGQVCKTDLFDDELAVWLPDEHIADVWYEQVGSVSKPTRWRPLPPSPTDQLPGPLQALSDALKAVKGGV